jgi:hypothetical protein
VEPGRLQHPKSNRRTLLFVYQLEGVKRGII